MIEVDDGCREQTDLAVVSIVLYNHRNVSEWDGSNSLGECQHCVIVFQVGLRCCQIDTEQKRVMGYRDRDYALAMSTDKQYPVRRCNIMGINR